LRCRAVQIFTHNRAQWRMRALTEGEATRFRETDRTLGPFALAAHSSYLINAASPDRVLRARSIDALLGEMDHCADLGIPLLVFHPGAHMGAGERAGISRTARAMNRLRTAVRRKHQDAAPMLAVEITAGSGTSIGWRFEHLRALFDQLDEPQAARVCFDTAHAFAAGYDFCTPAAYERLWSAFDSVIGFGRLGIFHLNDSRTACGSRVDRHAHIGRGEIGLKPFGWILNDPRFAHLPKVIETPKEGGMDPKNLGMLRRAAARWKRPR